MLKSFRHRGNPTLIYGAGKVSALADILPADATVFVLTGMHFYNSPSWPTLEIALRKRGLSVLRETVSGEPSPKMVDNLTATARNAKASWVLSIGGGSTLDSGKAVAAMLPLEGSVADYLEGVGAKKPQGLTVPMIAVPTTAGTGSEATTNAVISRRMPGGFKKSLRHDAFIPPIALLDPELALGCPLDITLACGMDAFCQLLESFLSLRANPITDMWARAGISRFAAGSRLFTENLIGSSEELDLRGELTLAAYSSGLALSNAGLGTIHGIAGPIGAVCDVPHGVVCGLLLPPVLRRIIRELRSENDERNLKRLAWVGAVLHRGSQDIGSPTKNPADAGCMPQSDDIDRLLNQLTKWTSKLSRLNNYGMSEQDIDTVIISASNKNSPIALDSREWREAIREIL